MRLQQQMMRKIDAFGGIDKLVDDLNQMVNTSKGKSSEILENMILYFTTLYKIEVNVEADAILYKDKSLETIEYLRQGLEYKDCTTSKFLIDLIQFKLHRATGVATLKVI